MTDQQVHHHRQEPSIRKHVAILTATGLGLWACTCGLWDLWGPDEARYVQIGKELLGRRNWFLLTLCGTPYDQKPPLPFWMLAAMLKMGGGEVHSGLVRLPSVFFAILSVNMSYLIGRRLWGARAGLIAAFALMTSAQFMEDAPTAKINVMYTGWTTLALAAWFLRTCDRRLGLFHAALFWAAMAGAFFTKGPVAFLIVLSALGAEAWFAKSTQPLLAVRPLPGLVFLAAAIGGWLYLQARAVGSDFVAEQVKGQTLERFLSGKHEEAFWYYLPRLFTSIFAPWAIPLVPAAVRLARLRRRLPPGMAALLGWIVIPFIVFTLANGKRQAYLLPLLPAMALIVGWYLNRLMAEGKTFPRVGRAVAVLSAFLGGAMVIFAAVLAAKPGLLTSHGLAFHILGFAMLALTGAATTCFGVWLARHAETRALIAIVLTAAGLIYGLLLFSAINPAMNPNKTTRPLALMLGAEARKRSIPLVGAVGRGAKPEYHVYGDYAVRCLAIEEVTGQNPDLPPLLVGRGGDWEKVHRQTPLPEYELLWSGEVSKDGLMIYIRK